MSFVQSRATAWSGLRGRSVATCGEAPWRCRFFRRAGHHLEKVLEHTTASITLRVEALHDAHRGHFRRLLKRLTRYGDRVYITVHEDLRDIIDVDSSVFNVVLEY